ncbi:MAG TPA: 2-phosphosulfolactate phosphatase [Fermentimonas caenicola]|jgi:2-phosphosulfolactate phosphatase|uniref:Probable 2-phosphosulfolactate phosphatase n=1 Tax=Fermentimonas caenicola TaxID=1562970 RepID=A0A098BYT3_9BACT|nr:MULTISPECIES: 2-phosphosulfolactate phosphatase [Lascolabacillus]MBP6175903.1 2-phosphosulfolactate phosphatase [Fermentimonas sp.]MDI9626066.1 2-phosphosulfolactate phosphatase [Bacteroidota bacterium]TAH62583.1 MAG: 2-phosphosulfolactate phosphatase [Fermentimonas caenicola]MBP6196435.1 2-phosphosulfolactate phosphatase [Fermentimonas sp.]MBP7104462.1 2-phosphosulfolactate phosphatase [Fermentimonas sp.]
MKLDLCPSPALYPHYKSDHDTVIVVDVFRASATMCTMLNNGASAIIPVSSIDEARTYKSEGYLVGAERKTQKCDFADFGNSPFDYSPEKVKDREVVFTTTNGTRAIEAASDCRELLIGTFINVDALVERCINTAERVVILCAGWNNRISIEDTLFGGVFAEKAMEKSNVEFDSDSIRMTLELWNRVKNDLMGYIEVSDHYRRLVDNGAVSDAAYCLTQNSMSVVPVYNKSDGKIY